MLAGIKGLLYLCTAIRKRALSSAGSERLPYKQRVGGSNPSAPTGKGSKNQQSCSLICIRGSGVLPYGQAAEPERIPQRPQRKKQSHIGFASFFVFQNLVPNTNRL